MVVGTMIDRVIVGLELPVRVFTKANRYVIIKENSDEVKL